jgi:hypothetical protein
VSDQKTTNNTNIRRIKDIKDATVFDLKIPFLSFLFSFPFFLLFLYFFQVYFLLNPKIQSFFVFSISSCCSSSLSTSASSLASASGTQTQIYISLFKSFFLCITVCEYIHIRDPILLLLLIFVSLLLFFFSPDS